MNDRLNAALRLADLGYRVFPCAPDAKRPLTEHGCLDATDDPAQIEAWWTRWPTANVAIATDGLLVVDIDRRDNPWPGEENKAADLNAAPQAITPRGGCHVYFRQPPGQSMRCTTSKLAPHVDTRADGGYVLAPPSRTDCGVYRWVDGAEICARDRLPEPPDWLVQALDALGSASTTSTVTTSSPCDSEPIPEGLRNATLTRMAGHARQAGHDRECIAALLHAVNERRCRPPLPRDEVERIASSVARYEPSQALQATLEGWADQDRAQALLEAEPVITSLADVAPMPIRWLWPGRIAIGKLTILVGDPGLGKSFLTLDLAARVTRGAAWPEPSGDCQNPNGPGGVLLLSAEDDIADTIRPRMDAAGGAVERVAVLRAVRRPGGKHKFFDLGEDLEVLDEAISRVPDCRLVVVDPISAYLGSVDSHNNAEVRAMLAPLADLAAKRGVAVLAVSHLRKGSGKAIYRAMGSLAFTAAARAAYVVARDPDDESGQRRLFLPIKNNLGPDTTGLAYRLEGEFSSTPIVVWEEQPVAMSADEALYEPKRRPGPEPTERNEAVEWLREMLKNGPRAARKIIAEAKEVGISKGTLDRAKRPAGVVSEKLRNGEWVWKLEDSQVPPIANN